MKKNKPPNIATGAKLIMPTSRIHARLKKKLTATQKRFVIAVNHADKIA